MAKKSGKSYAKRISCFTHNWLHKWTNKSFSYVTRCPNTKDSSIQASLQIIKTTVLINQGAARMTLVAKLATRALGCKFLREVMQKNNNVQALLHGKSRYWGILTAVWSNRKMTSILRLSLQDILQLIRTLWIDIWWSQTRLLRQLNSSSITTWL